MNLTSRGILSLVIVGIAWNAYAAARIKVVDKLPDRVPRGYVEFYVGEGQNVPLKLSIWDEVELRPNKGPSLFILNKVFLSLSPKDTIRIARKPGANILFVSFSGQELHGGNVPDDLGYGAVTSSSENAKDYIGENVRVALNVEEGRITPIRLDISNFSSQREKGGKKFSLNMNAQVESSVPVGQSPNEPRNAQGGTAAKAPATPSLGVSITAQFPVAGVTFTIESRDVEKVFQAQALLKTAAEGLDLTKESDKETFLKRYRDGRKQHRELGSVLISCRAISGL